MSSSDRRMNDTEAMMWRMDKDPFLSSTFANVTILDRAPDMDMLRQRMERTALLIPRLRQRVVSSPGNIGNPMWADDPTFDINYHVRHMSLPAPGSMRQLLDLATLIVADPFDRARPLWQFIVVEGLEGGQSSLIEKLHHTISDGQGGVELSLQFLDLERHPAPLPPLDPEFIERAESASQPDATEALRGAMTDSLRIPLAVLRQVRDVLSDPALLGTVGSSTAATVRGLMSQLSDNDSAHSPIWKERSLRRRLETLSVPYRDLRSAAKELGGKINTAFLTAAADAAGRYHRQVGAPVEQLRASMAISTRSNEGPAGNAFNLARLLVPTGEMPVQERFRAIDESITAAREVSAASPISTISTVASLFPTAVVTRLARAQSQTVDFATSNVRGAGIPLYVAGAQLLQNYPVGPLGGVAFNLTLLSYLGNLDMGLNIDAAAIDHPELLRECMQKSFNDVASLAVERDEAVAPSIKRRWWRRKQRA